MKRIIVSIIGIFATAVIVSACEDKPITFEQLPKSARIFITTYFPEDEVSFVLKDDDVVRPDYEVMLVSGTKLEFEHSGNLSKIECSRGIKSDVVPEQIRNYVMKHYPGEGFIEYEVDRKSYEVKLTNRLEIKFSSSFNVLEIDD